MSNNFVSIIVTSYNKGKYLNDCLASVFNQDYTNWECLIINDGSTDNTKEIAETWVSKDKRFIYFEHENQGVIFSKNFGISKASNQWILPLDGDDLIGTKYLNEASLYFDKAYVKLISCKALLFGANEGIWNLPNFSINNLAKFNMIHNSSIFRKIDWENIGGYDSNMYKGLEDWEFWINLLKNSNNENVITLDCVGLHYRILEGSRQSSIDKKDKKDLFRYIEKKHFDFLYDQLGSKINTYNICKDLESKLNSPFFKFINSLYSTITKYIR